jgi:hypothetical protein
MVSTTDVIIPENTGNSIPGVAAHGLPGEGALAERFQRKNLFNKDMVFEFTRDPALLQQYYRIRAKEYKAVHGVDMPAIESEDDRGGHILVARMENFCVGGMRLNVKTPRKLELLPMEVDGFMLEKHFPYLRYKQMRYCQASGFALLHEFHGGEVSRVMIERILQKAHALNLEMLFATTPILNARLYRHDCFVMGWKDPKIHYDIVLPDDPTSEGIKLYLFSVTIDKHSAKNSMDMLHDNDLNRAEEHNDLRSCEMFYAQDSVDETYCV